MKKIIIILLFAFPEFLSAQIILGGNDNDFCTKVISISNEKSICVGGSRSFSAEKSQDVFIQIIDNNIVTTKTYGNQYHDVAYGISPLSDGNFIISGKTNEGFGVTYGEDNPFLMKINSNGDVIWRKAYYFPSFDGGLNAKELSDKNILLIGYIRNKTRDILLLKTNKKGDTIWHKSYNFIGDDYAYDFVETDNGNLLILGEAGGCFNYNQTNLKDVSNSDIVVMKTDLNGDTIKTLRIGGTGNELAKKIIKAEDNSGYYIIGSTQSYGNGSFDVFLIKIDEDLNILWQKSYGTDKMEYGTSICQINDVLFVSEVYETSDFLPNSRILMFSLNGTLLQTTEIDMDSITYITDLNKSANNLLITGYSGKNNKNLDGFFISKKKDDLITFLLAYPNPAYDEINLKLASRDEKISIKIFDETGKLMIDKKNIIYPYKIDVSALKQGLYFYKIYDYSIKYSGKFIIVSP